jgi:hypothetical protein
MRMVGRSRYHFEAPGRAPEAGGPPGLGTAEVVHLTYTGSHAGRVARDRLPERQGMGIANCYMQ